MFPSSHLQTINTLRPRQNGRHFTDDTFKHMVLNESARISIEISLKFVPESRINNIPAMVQIMVPTRHYLNQWWLDYRQIYASLGLNELIESAVAYRCCAKGTTKGLIAMVPQLSTWPRAMFYPLYTGIGPGKQCSTHPSYNCTLDRSYILSETEVA